MSLAAVFVSSLIAPVGEERCVTRQKRLWGRLQDYGIARKFGSIDGIEESYWGPSRVNKLRAFFACNIHISWIAPHICHKLISSSQVSVRRIINVLVGNSVPCASDSARWLFVRPKSAVIFTIPVKVPTVVAWYV